MTKPIVSPMDVPTNSVRPKALLMPVASPFIDGVAAGADAAGATVAAGVAAAPSSALTWFMTFSNNS